MCALISFLWVKTYKGANHTVWITAGRQHVSLCNVRKPAIKIKTKALGPPRCHHGRQWWHCHRNIHAGFNSTPETWVTADLANTYRRGLSAAAASSVAAWYTSAPSFKCVMSTLLIINQLQPRWFPATLIDLFQTPQPSMYLVPLPKFCSWRLLELLALLRFVRFLPSLSCITVPTKCRRYSRTYNGDHVPFAQQKPTNKISSPCQHLAYLRFFP